MNSSSNIINLSQPAADIELENLTFADLFDVEEIQAIQDSFALATGVASIITDPEGRPITRASNFCRLCIEIIRGTPNGLANCMKSDAAIGRPNPSGPIVQPCLSGGLVDAGASIMVGDHHIANWLIGQVLDGEPDEARMLAYAEQIGANKEDFRAALKQVTRMSREQFDQISQTLFLIAQQMSKLAIQNLQQKRYLAQRQQAEVEREQILKEQRRLAAVLNNTTDLVGMINMQGKSIYVNPAGMAMMGRTGQDPTSLVVTDFHPPEAGQRVQTEHLPAIMKNGHHTWENVLQHADGHTIPVSQASLLIYNEAGEPEVMATIMRDISAQKQAMAEQERLQQEIIDAQRRALQELSTPIIPVMEQIIVMPLIGSIDSMRARDITRTLLAGIRENRAKVVILDITGVPLVDSGVASHLNKTIQAARLKGARTIITGVSDAVAETIVDLGIDWRGVETLADLQTGLVVALASLGVKLTKI